MDPEAIPSFDHSTKWKRFKDKHPRKRLERLSSPSSRENTTGKPAGGITRLNSCSSNGRENKKKHKLDTSSDSPSDNEDERMSTDAEDEGDTEIENEVFKTPTDRKGDTSHDNFHDARN